MSYVLVVLPESFTQLLSICVLTLLIITVACDYRYRKKQRSMHKEIENMYKALMNLPIGEVRRSIKGNERD
ncbi:hypothetical protein M5X00_17445 [Paenibacillus alvei]|uniref:Uncharacterized protein n=1 Tax=Paenibacillus alvei TaxID=44250 RepID=A0ABT4GZV3_PAEAL|nr:hypothetical protein [Paenibacillus alvei]EJW19158.1 hypothetical protein PAV_1c01290 [Paenibacillus alvei DSM 29]MCY9541840.1 hypothetical protein [Paenibacillus alvei]MCY9706324.1 hypothetical protein [Paenibacillus alvei]MCY9732240.1 hypothetical protein [Paenibacillus alvei]MCY9756024.1 hypothetical protein [Paenibacillus alvei]